MDGDAPRRQAGLLGRTFMQAFLTQAQVVAAETLACRFRLITLASPAFRLADWKPGHKLQIAMRSAFATRTYTPIDWDTATGQTRILGYVHGNGPGSDWVRNTYPGDVCNVLGPRKSLDTSFIGNTSILFGDETSIGLAYALKHGRPDRNLKGFFESGDPESVRNVLDTLGLDDVVVVAAADGMALEDGIGHLHDLVEKNVDFVLTGQARSIQRIRRTLKD
jgi:NADPH-dependent ferric siderophore reductase